LEHAETKKATYITHKMMEHDDSADTGIYGAKQPRKDESENEVSPKRQKSIEGSSRLSSSATDDEIQIMERFLFQACHTTGYEEEYNQYRQLVHMQCRTLTAENLKLVLLVTSYSQLSREIPDLVKTKLISLIEAHLIKSATTVPQAAGRDPGKVMFID
jgi:hypothetical protein